MLKRKSRVVMLAIFAFVLCNIFFAQKVESGTIMEIGTLKGLEDIEIYIYLSDTAQNYLSEDQIKVDVELKIRSIAPELIIKDTSSAIGSYISLSINAFAPQGDDVKGIIIYFTELTLDQYGWYRRIDTGLAGMVMGYGATWQTKRGPGIVGANNFAEAIRSAVKDMIDEFLNDYLKANPRKKP